MVDDSRATPVPAPIAWQSVQAKLNVAIDGKAGPLTYAALMSAIAGHAISTATAALYAKHIPAYAVDLNPRRLSAFLGQCCHESMRFACEREVWGPTAYQKLYDVPGNQLGDLPGDAFALRGDGPIEVTGRYWLTRIGIRLGLNLVGTPSLLNDPETGVLVTLEWWTMNGINAVADGGDDRAVTRKINPGMLGLAERIAFTIIARAILA